MRQGLRGIEELQIAGNDRAEISAQRSALHEGMTLFSQGLELLASRGERPEKDALIEALLLVEAGNHRINDGIALIKGELEEEQQSRAVFGSAWLDAAGKQIGR